MSPSRRITPHEFDAAKITRDEASEYIGALFPSARVVFGLDTFDGQVRPTATIGSTAPHSREEVAESLQQLGVVDITGNEA